MKALITDGVHPVLLQDFETMGIEVVYAPKIEQDEVESQIHEFDILIINSKIQVDKAFIDKASKLKIVGRLGSGLEIIDLAYAVEKNIHVVNSPEGNRDAVGEHVVAMLLCLFNKLLFAHQDVLNFDWNREANRGVELKGMKVGLIGYGNTGKSVAKKLQGFETEVYFYDKYLEQASDAYATQVSLAEMFELVDVLSFHLPYNEETHHFCDNEFITQFKKPIYLINTSRGKIVKTGILRSNLDENRLLGVCLDVFENEKPVSYSKIEKDFILQLQATGKALFSTHVAGWTDKSKYKLSKIISEKIEKFL